MACFSDEAIALFTEWRRDDLRARLQNSYQEMVDRRVDAVEYRDPATLKPKELALANSRLLQQALLHRSVALMNATGPMLIAKNIYGTALVARGQVEASAVLGYFCHRISALTKGNIDFEQFQKDLSVALLGARHDLFDKATAPANILTCIEKTDKFLDDQIFKEKKGVIHDIYGWLSEFTHPNFCSNKCAFDLDKKNHRMVLRNEAKLSDDDFQLLGHLELSAMLFPRLFDEFGERIQKQLAQ